MVYEYRRTLLKNVYLFILYSNNSIAEGLRRSYNGSGYNRLFLLLGDIWSMSQEFTSPQNDEISLQRQSMEVKLQNLNDNTSSRGGLAHTLTIKPI